jgi:hypothetical protein
LQALSRISENTAFAPFGAEELAPSGGSEVFSGMSHFIDKFVVDHWAGNIRIGYAEFQVPATQSIPRLVCILKPEVASRLAEALDKNLALEEIIAGETGESLTVNVTPMPLDDRQVQISLQIQLPGVHAQQLARALRE